jgi:hypothetical protein
MNPAPATIESGQLPTCCSSHPDLATLTQHLVAGYSQIRSDAVVDAVWRAYSQTTVMALPPPERLRAVEQTCRYQLEIACRCAGSVAQPSGSTI